MDTEKFAGTLKLEIIKPLDVDWKCLGDRLQVLRSSVAPALNYTMRETYTLAIDYLECIKNKSENTKEIKYKFESAIDPVLRNNWNKEIVRFQEFTNSSKRSNKNEKCWDSLAFAPVTEYFSAETRHHIIDRFKGSHLKELIAAKASIPNWTRGCAFYIRSRSCAVEGNYNEAILTLPLWGAGKKSTRVAVAPSGGSAIVMWKRLVAGEVKLGRVGITRDENRKKWYALVSWTEEREAKLQVTGSVAVNFGVNVFLQAVSDDGKTHRVHGQDIIVQRKRMSHRRREIQENLNTFGTGSKGHGIRRRMRPVTNLEDKESRYCTTKCRQVAADLVNWCIEHQKGTIYLEDLSGIMDNFEKQTNGEAHEEVKRYIHSWPFYELGEAIKRRAKFSNVTVKQNEASYNSQRCPHCHHTSKDNLKEKVSYFDSKEFHGRQYTANDRIFRFVCAECGFNADADLVAASNHHEKATGNNPIAKAHWFIKKAVSEEVEKITNN